MVMRLSEDKTEQSECLHSVNVKVWVVVLQTKEGEDFTIMKMAPTRAFSWLKDTMLNGHLNMVSRCEIGRWRKY